MPCLEFCNCNVYDCPAHPKKHNGECTPCIEKNLKHHEIPFCFWSKIGDVENVNSPYTFYKFAENVMTREDGNRPPCD